MPFKKYTKKRTYKRKTNYKTKNTNLTKRIKTIVKRLAPQEIKYHDLSLSQGVGLSAAEMLPFLLNGITVGSGLGGRIGENIFIKNIQYTFSWKNLEPINQTFRMRWMILIDKHPEGVLFTKEKLLENTGDSQQIMDTYLEKDYSRKFKVLKQGHLWIKTDADDPDYMKYKKGFINFKTPLKVKYNGSGNLIDSIQNNAVYIMFIPEVAIANYQHRYDHQIRVRYMDG